MSKSMTAIELSDQYSIGILIKQASFQTAALRMTYINPLVEKGLTANLFIAHALPYNDNNKAPKTFAMQHLPGILQEMVEQGVTTLYCADASYFKILTKKQKTESFLGYVVPCAIEKYEHLNVVYGINHTSLIFNPINQNKLNLSLEALYNHVTDQSNPLEQSFLDNPVYPVHQHDIINELRRLMKAPMLCVDIETFSLKAPDSGIATIAFADSPTTGTAFQVDYAPHAKNSKNLYGKQTYNAQTRQTLRNFFDCYQGQLVFHNAPFDTKILIHELYMKDSRDNAGLRKGLELLYRNLHDTRIISYLALNSTAGNELSLKALAHSYAGNYAQSDDDIKDVRRIELPQLLEYNLIDSCCTYHIYNQYEPELDVNEQRTIYTELMLPSLKGITHMELVGMPLLPKQVAHAREKLEVIRQTYQHTIYSNPLIEIVNEQLTRSDYEHDYKTRRNKAKNPDKIKIKDYQTYPRKVFNPASNQHLAVLLHDHLDLPVLGKTPTGQPAVGADNLAKLVHHTDDTKIIDLLDALIGFAKVDKILSTFITAFEKAYPDLTSVHAWLYGSFNLCGAVSGRLSSSSPNLQNLPNNSTYGKLVKQCVQAPPGWLFVGADFASLEAMINALTTKDPNKLTIYENNLDSHSWNTFGYWPEKMPDIQAKMALSESPGKFYKRTNDDGSVEYLHESEL